MIEADRIAGGAATLPRLISVEEAATLLAVTDTTVRNWINAEVIPYIELPRTGSRRRFRIPLQGLLNTLSGNYDLAGDLDHLTAVLGVSEPATAEDAAFESRARPRGGNAVGVEGDVRDLFEHAQGRDT